MLDATQNRIRAVRAMTDEETVKTGVRPAALVLTFGCQQNEADSERLRGMLREMGYAQTEDAAQASVVLLNTCAIREHAELKALSIVGSFKKYKEEKPSLIIGVCGCMTAEAHRVEELKHRYPYVDFTMTPAAIGALPELIGSRLERGSRRFLLDTPDTVLAHLPVERASAHRAWVSIMYGCNNFCSYCIVPYVRGRERSRPVSDILAEVRTLVADGVRDITLLGQNVNSYRDACDFPDLLTQIDAIEGDYVLRFMTSHPKDASDKLIRVLAEAKHIEPHFHLPLQSGSDRILARMNRHYDMAHYLSVVEKIRAVRPDMALSSDIIVGFPGENEEDFEATLSALTRIRFDSVYSFIYSPRRGTPAAEMADAVPSEVQSARFRRLLDLQADIGREKNLALAGKTVRVLVDGPSKSDAGVYSGRTDGGKLVHLSASEADIGKFLTVHIDRAESFALFGTSV